MLHHLWTHGFALCEQYGVDPLVFAVLYVAHHPLFWGTMAWLAVRVKRRQSTEGVIILAVLWWLLPYGYVFLWGRGLPAWTYAAAALVLCIGGAHAVKEVRRRLRP